MIVEEVKLDYKHGKIHAFKQKWEEEEDGKIITYTKITCYLYRDSKPCKFLNLGGTNDGSNFTAVAQAVNEAKWLIDYDIEQDLNFTLLESGISQEELFKYNSLRISERVDEKERLKNL